MTRDATQGAPRRFPDGPKMLFEPSKMATIEREPTQDELTQDEGEYFSMGEGKGEGKQRCSNTPQDPRRGRRTFHRTRTSEHVYEELPNQIPNNIFCFPNLWPGS